MGTLEIQLLTAIINLGKLIFQYYISKKDEKTEVLNLISESIEAAKILEQKIREAQKQIEKQEEQIIKKEEDEVYNIDYLN